MQLSLFQNLPIRQKLVLLIVGITGTALFLFTLLSAFHQIRIMRQSMVDNLNILSESIADLSTAALSFSDTRAAHEILMTLRADGDIELAAIYDAEGEPFARYQHPEYARPKKYPDKIKAESLGFIQQEGSYKLELFRPIALAGREIGTLYVLSGTGRMAAQLANSVVLLFVGLLVLLGATVLISTRLQRLITRPVFTLASISRKISDQGDYGMRVEKTSHDEIGQLIDDFNAMLEAIQDRDAELQEHHQNLEKLVRERTEELRAKRDEALAAARAKSEFLANMSHEIRTPMNGVIGVLSLLRDAPMTEEYHRLLDTATRSADSLLSIINDILDFSKIDAGMVVFEFIHFDLRALMEETSELFIDTVNLKKLDLTCCVPTEIPCRVKGDPTRLRQILTNLLSNAVKFTDHGEVRLKVSVASRDERNAKLIFTIEDTGIGIPEETTGKLFDQFTQADGSTTRKYGGTGLGLSVCKQLVEQQGGEIGVNSRLGSGSTFWFTLPVVVVAESCPVIPYAELSHKHYLLVDDNATNCDIIKNYLDFCDARLSSCGDPDSGFAKLGEMMRDGIEVAGVLIDYSLPGENGLQLAERITRTYGTRTPELILLNSSTFSQDLLRQAGIRSLLFKPARQLELYNVLANKPVREGLPFANSETAESESLPRVEGSILLVDDEPINQKIAVAILKKFGLKTEVASTGYEAIEKTSQKSYSVVLMDIQMPVMSGYEATEIIRKREQQSGKSRAVIIAMTASALETTRRRCLETGMDDFFTKPIKPDILLERLRPWLEINEDPEPAGAEPVDEAIADADSNQAEIGTTTWDPDTALSFVGGDKELFRDLIGLFLERNSILLSAIESAIELDDRKGLWDAAHAYKGAVNHFAAATVRQLAATLERMGKEGEMEGTKDLFNELKGAAAKLQGELDSYLLN